MVDSLGLAPLGWPRRRISLKAGVSSDQRTRSVNRRRLRLVGVRHAFGRCPFFPCKQAPDPVGMVFNESVARHAAQEPQHHGVPHGGHSEHHAQHVQRPIPYQKAGTLRQKPPQGDPRQRSSNAVRPGLHRTLDMRVGRQGFQLESKRDCRPSPPTGQRPADPV